MCGFAGVFQYGARSGSVSPEVVVRMRDVLRHRGPDGEGLFVSPDRRVGLGHRRLAIVDLDHGAQPMFGRGGECLVYNGEIYNYPRLRPRLESEGLTFDTHCDTEVILRLYERDGIDCLAHLNGMFAFALWDAQRQRLLLARDRIGEKPLYWFDSGDTIVFGSEIKALLEHPSVRPEVNRDALPAYLAHLVTPAPETLFRGIYKLAPGELAVCDAGGMRVSRYWDLFSPRRWSDTPLTESVPQVRAMLDRSVEDRLMSDVPIGVLLSGGLDSTALVGLLRDRARGLATFSVGFEAHPELDERAEARRVAEHFGTDHHEVTVSEAEALEFLPKLIRHQDEPLADPVCMPLHFVCELAAANGVKVVLGGEGSDELFWGYNPYVLIMHYWGAIRMARLAPRVFRRAFAARISPEDRPAHRELAEGIAARRLPPMHSPLGINRFHRELLLGGQTGDTRWAPSDSHANRGRPRDALGFDTQEYEFGLRLPELLLMRIDRFSMANSIEARVPFLDPDLVDFAYRLNPNQKLAHGETKIVLRRAVQDVVPDWVMARRKQGFGAPVADWFTSRMGELLRSLVRSDSLREYFDPAAVDAMLIAPHRATRFALWPVLNFALWHKAWIEGEDLRDTLERALPLEGIR
jgi:asparagine synthase (glutamine-hydrolysing)